MFVTRSYGFGLIEVLVAMLVISITVPALFLLQKNIYDRYNHATNITTAYSLANDELEQLSAIRALEEFKNIGQSSRQVETNGIRFLIVRNQPTDIELDKTTYPNTTGNGTTEVVVRGKSVEVQVFHCRDIDVDGKCSNANNEKLATLSRIIAPLDAGYITP